MKNKEDELLEFFDYLEKKRKQIMEELEPYYERLDRRLEAHMNAYGIATPKDNCLLRELEVIINVENKLKLTQDIAKLKENLNKKITEEKDTETIARLQKEAEVITEYEHSKNANPSNKTI